MLYCVISKFTNADQMIEILPVYK